jgi:hypothetical protein
LASVLGEVKPPVASKEEILAAGGVSKVGEQVLHPLEGDRCLVCLSDYEKGEECRTLSGCGHLFHRECIDQVSPPHKSMVNGIVVGLREECMSVMSRNWCCLTGYKSRNSSAGGGCSRLVIFV